MAENIVVNGVQYNGVDSVEMKTPDGRSVGFYPDAVRYNAQDLTAAQKEQARKNIDAMASSELQEGVNTALSQAKESGEFDGQRGTGLIAITTTPSAYTTEVNGLTPAYRVALSTVKSQGGVTEVKVGDVIQRSYYHYPVIYVDASYVYTRARVSIRGAAYTLTDADKNTIAEAVKSSLTTHTITGIDANGTTHTWTVYGG